MTRLATILGAAVAVVVVGVGLWLVFGRDDAPAEFELTETDAASEDVDADEDAGAAEAAPGDLDGVWAVGTGSEAGYRVVEDLGEVLDFEAVGRTDQVTGEMEISGGEVIGGLFEVDVASITSDDGRRDGQFVGPIMNAAEFPTANLELTGPIPVSGASASTQATGTLTLRGASNDVTFPVEAQIIGDQIEVVASIDVLFSDYGIDNPSNPLVSVRDEGKVEVRLLFGRS